MKGKEIIREEVRGTQRDGEWQAGREKEKKEWRGEDKTSTDRYDFTDYLLSAVMN